MAGNLTLRRRTLWSWRRRYNTVSNRLLELSIVTDVQLWDTVEEALEGTFMTIWRQEKGQRIDNCDNSGHTHSK